ncbi:MULTISPECIES: hypothetical protein [Actinosynnema]|uniref:hypothetical protein n=1 Tax=Actinosynnema TaxID=40566 RepID=UPI0020A4274D|nr:hypothetical protein [Actinosynnema pretiosum]MCP2097449.1 hypothetical protein [Actinosynnema pretiosum]
MSTTHRTRAITTTTNAAAERDTTVNIATTNDAIVNDNRDIVEQVEVTATPNRAPDGTHTC